MSKVPGNVFIIIKLYIRNDVEMFSFSSFFCSLLDGVLWYSLFLLLSLTYRNEIKTFMIGFCYP